MRIRTLVFILISAVLASTGYGDQLTHVIDYKVTARMWDGADGGSAPTSEEMLEKIHSAFELWESASFGSIAFQYGGLAQPSYDSRAQIPFDGSIYVVLNGRYNFHDEAANADYHGEIPLNYQRGAVFIKNTAKPVSQFILVHEIGHALGLAHSASNASVMFSGNWSGSLDTVHELAETDTAALRAVWAPDSPGLYTISGTTETMHSHAMAFVFAVNAQNGRTFSSRADHLGRFTVALSAPGEYYLVAKAVEASQDVYPSYRKSYIPHSASWYARDGISVAHHARAKRFKLDPLNSSASDLKLRLLDKPAPYPLTWAKVQSRSHQKGFLRPGEMAILRFPQIPGFSGVESFGTDPDFSFEPISTPSGYVSGAILRVDIDAEPGERLVKVTSSIGKNLGLVGIYIREAEVEFE